MFTRVYIYIYIERERCMTKFTDYNSLQLYVARGVKLNLGVLNVEVA